MRGREIRLTARPRGTPTKENFELVEVDVPQPDAGEVLVRNTHMSVDPYMRGRMNAGPSYVPAFEVGKALEGGVVGTVEQSNDASLPVGATVLSWLGWRDYAVGSAKMFRKIDTALAPASAYLGVLGTTGFSAWVGLFVIDDVKAGETALISSAAGAVGSVAGQLAKRRGARVIGTTRSAASAQIVRDKLHFDDVIVLREGEMSEQLRAAVPDGIDFYFENVGGELLEAALASLRPNGRICACGMIANYNNPVPGPRNIYLVTPKRLKMTGFIVSDHNSRFEDFVRDVAPAVASGEIVALETMVDGLENAPDALLSLFAGGHVGKVVVKIA
jgi:NADPH-dependent curcumin reductase CurA